MSEYYEIVIFTCSLQRYADPILSKLQGTGEFISHILYRESTTSHNGLNTKNLLRLGRDMSKTIIIDNLKSCFQL